MFDSAARKQLDEIKTTVVGSYPMIDWLAAAPSDQALLDATAVVLKTQELAGLEGKPKLEFRKLFLSLADERELPALFHCTTGKDRTG